jgi:hypothetical protein
MGRPGGLQRYAGLDDTRPSSAPAEEFCPRDDTHGAVFGADERDTTEAGARRRGRPKGDPGDGTKSLARLEARMAARAMRAELRDAMDLLRQQDLLENIDRRRARTRQRRWFVLGRALDAAMANDAGLGAAIMAALDTQLSRRDERALMGLGPKRSK